MYEDIFIPDHSPRDTCPHEIEVCGCKAPAGKRFLKQ